MKIIREILEAIKIFSEPSDEDVHTANEKEKSKKRARKLMHESTIESLKITQMSLRNDLRNDLRNLPTKKQPN